MPSTEVAWVGWDVGGAHLKVVALDKGGRAVAALHVPSPLWQGLDRLQAALDQVFQALPPGASAARHAVTMTGELADLFADRTEGVRSIVRAVRGRIAAPLRFFAGPRGFLDPDQAVQYAADVASANWLATAQLLADRLGDGLLVDIGSTTTDLVAVHAGRIEAAGRTDFERLMSGELVYTGVVRTPLMSISDAIEFDGLRIPLMAEHFATTADVYRLTGELDERFDQHPAADGAEKSIPGSARRLARMIGRDARELPIERWQQLAASFRAAQLERIRRAAQQVLLRGVVGPTAPLLAAGSGHFLVGELAHSLRRPVAEFARLVESRIDPVELAACAPAVAVALLAQRANP
jgi:probable H4MPT-linked C1 transfer pathway protein